MRDIYLYSSNDKNHLIKDITHQYPKSKRATHARKEKKNYDIEKKVRKMIKFDKFLPAF